MTAVAKSLIVNATRQAHWQAHKTNRTKANLPKTSPSCSAWVTVFRRTQLKCKFLITDRGKGERTIGVVAMLADEYILIFLHISG
jgi:hypothetical protein